MEKTVARLRRSFDIGVIAVKASKTAGTGFVELGAYLLPDDPAFLPIYEAIKEADGTLVTLLAAVEGA